MRTPDELLSAERDVGASLAKTLIASGTPVAIYGQLCSYAKNKRYKHGWADHKFKELFGFDPDNLFEPEAIEWIGQTVKVWSLENKR